MRLTVRGVLVSNLEVLCHSGSQHRKLAPVFRAGSHCVVLGVGKGEASLRTILDAALALRAGSNTQDQIAVFSHITDFAGTAERIADEKPPPAGEALCLLIADKPGRLPPWSIFQSATSLALGRIPPCTLDDLRTTWSRLVGGALMNGRFLLEESDTEWDAGVDRRLTERLRELYGE